MLTHDQQRFVELFLSARGNIKEVEQLLGISYPTVRKKLDEVAAILGSDAIEETNENRARQEVLTRIERGELNAREGARLLRGIR